jgi:transposase
LLAHGLISASFVPEPPIQELRDLTRTRKQFVRQRAQHVNRIHKVLEDANIKLGSFISDITGISGRAILEALIAGEADAKKLAVLGNSRLKTPRETLALALEGRLTKHHRFLLKTHLDQVDVTDRSIGQLDARIEEAARPFVEMVDRITEMPGVSKTAAHVVLAEIGHDMSRFPTAAHLVSFAGLCPRLDESAGKRRSTRVRKGSNWLKGALVSCAWAAARSKNTYARAQYHRIKTRRGAKKAVVAVAASMLTAIYHVLRNNVPYRDLGAQHFDRRDRLRIANRLRRRLEELGYAVQIAPAA